MPIKVIDGDLFDTKASYICHQVNCKGKMGSGVARQVKQRFPVAYKEYVKKCRESDILGQIQIVKCGDVNICNMFAQDGYGYNGDRFTNYDALKTCLDLLENVVPDGEVIAMPYGIGCGLGGGDWGIVYAMIDSTLKKHVVELWRRGE